MANTFMKPRDGYVSIKDYALTHNISRDTVAHWIHRGRLKADFIDGHWYIPDDAKPQLNAHRKRAYKCVAPELKKWSGEEIRRHRLDLNLSMKELGKLTGVSWHTIQRLEKDKYEPRNNLGLFVTLVLMKIEEAQKNG